MPLHSNLDHSCFDFHLLQCLRLGCKEVEMQNNKNDNKLTFEFHIKLQMEDYRLRYVTKKGWIVALILIVIKLGLLAVRAGP